MNVCEPQVLRTLNFVAALWWTGMLLFAVHKRRFGFGRWAPSGGSRGIDLAARPTAYRVCVGIYVGIILILVAEGFVWPWPIPMATLKAFMSSTCR